MKGLCLMRVMYNTNRSIHLNSTIRLVSTRSQHVKEVLSCGTCVLRLLKNSMISLMEQCTFDPSTKSVAISFSGSQGPAAYYVCVSNLYRTYTPDRLVFGAQYVQTLTRPTWRRYRWLCSCTGKVRISLRYVAQI